jgi:uncharacterized protein (TIGR02466 family)
VGVLMNAEITPLFAVPAYHAHSGIYNFDEEINFLKQLELIPSQKNFVSKNQSIFDHPEMARCKNIAEQHVQNFVANVFKCKQQLYITNSWTAKSLTNESHHTHHHPNSVISGVLYLQCSPGNGNIKFHHKSPLKDSFNFTYDFTDYNIFNADVWSYAPVTGELLLFPSWLNHEVEKNLNEEPRIVIGFNTFVKGTFNSTYAAELTL